MYRINDLFLLVIVWLQPATTGPHGRPSSCQGADENGEKQAKNWWDKGSLTEQQRKGTITTMMPIRRIHNTNRREPLSQPATATRSRTTTTSRRPATPNPNQA